MVEFGTGYFNSMDREYVSNSDSHTGHNCDNHHDTNDVNIKAGDFGHSFGLGPVPNIPQILSKLHAGGKTIELSFFGMGKGSGQGHTAGMYGKKQRQALREKSAANRLDFTTHTSVGVFGLAGQDRQGNFTRDAKITSLQEIKRAIEFAADVGQGGPVVVHTGEFNRPFSETKWNQEGKYAGKFESFPGEDERASFYVVDRRTGAVIQKAEKGRSVTKTVLKKYEEGDSFWDKKSGGRYTDNNGKTVSSGDYIDDWGNKVERKNAVPIFDEKIGGFKTKQVGWDDLKQEAQILTNEARKFWKENKNSSEDKWNNSRWSRFRGTDLEKDIEVLPEEAYIISNLETNAADARGFALQYTRDYNENIESVEKLVKAKELYKKIEDETDEEEKWRLKKQVAGLAGDLVPRDAQFPSEIIDEQIKNHYHRIKQAQTSAAGQWTRAAEHEELMKHAEAARKYALDESYDSYARAGIYAVQKSDVLRKQGKLKRNIMVAMENLFPEAYGAHPDEIMKIVEGSRNKMAQQLEQEYNYNSGKARELAENTLTITFDTGHLNMWRKYWKNDSSKTLAENDKEFDNWTVDMVEKMAKKKMIGHVHLDDNYGYQDEHLAPGEGNAPIKRMITVLKKNGYEGNLIVEPGADFTLDSGGFSSVMKTWKLFGSSVYGATSTSMGEKAGNWGNIQYSHFGQAQPPYFTFQPYSPSEDWTLWSGVPLE